MIGNLIRPLFLQGFLYLCAVLIYIVIIHEDPLLAIRGFSCIFGTSTDGLLVVPIIFGITRATERWLFVFVCIIPLYLPV